MTADPADKAHSPFNSIDRGFHRDAMQGEDFERVRSRITEVVEDWKDQLEELLGEANKILLRQNDELQNLSFRLKHEVEQIQQIQESLLPQHAPVIEGLEFATHYLPSSEASGDYFDFLDVSRHHVGILVADVSGHGAASAVVMAITRVLAQAHLNQLLSPGGALSVLNGLMAKFVPGDQFVTAVYAIYNQRSHTVAYATAGHPPPILWRHQSKSIEILPVRPRFPLRLFPQVEYDTLECQLNAGDALLLYTDGLTELQDDTGEMVGEELIGEWMASSPNHSASGILWHLLDKSSQFTKGVPPKDDFTLVIIKRTDEPAS